MVRAVVAAALTAAALSGCGSEPAPEHEVELLPVREQLIRLSVDLRGVHPTEEELRIFAAAADPSNAYEQFVDAWLEDERFLDRIGEVFDQRYLFRTGEVYFDPSEAGLNIDDRVMAGMIADEPHQLLRYIVRNELPYSEIVTADHSMANPELALFWGMDYPEEASGGWVPARYTDGRPHAGVLTMSTMWQRYPSMGGNANRHRANAISKMFLCDDYLARPIVLNRAAVDQLLIDPENAISQNDTCQSCHSTLDPIAGNFFGFYNYEAEDGLDQTMYRPENEEEWRNYSGREPGYYGRPTANIPEFAADLAQDSRFVDCAVQTVWEGLTQRTMTDADWEEVQPHRAAFEASDMNIKELVRSIVLTSEYKGHSALSASLEERLVGAKVVSPKQLSSIIAEATGYRWWFDGRDGLAHNEDGLGVLAGGIDGLFVTQRSYTPSVSAALVAERVAQAAGYYVASHDLDTEREGPAKLLLFVTVRDTPESNPEAFDEQIRHLYLAITGVPLPEDAPEPDQLVAVWKYLYSIEASPTLAWAGVVSAVLRDPRVLFY